ncbi:hypothetical protein GCM10007989_02160 [Devosia pacifica]|uniref:SPOR domain-containing protein n=1 Tax=Devosia pacifica TaxID=1335967 RepID=A0A918RWI2_9HYPH|nr:hypothetical protein [Devosia pacifica]GHA11423.1 hypothetical protein GCM10007989_02160 [Devosia pacifica]
MAKASDEFRQADVMAWGLIALGSCVLAVLSANVAALLPASALQTMHAARLQTSSVEQMSRRLRSLEVTTQELAQQNTTLRAQLDMQTRDGDTARRRIGALESSLPGLLSGDDGIDRSLATASIDSGETEPAQGGSVRVEYRALPEAGQADVNTLQPLPEPLNAGAEIAETTFAVALGPSITEAQAPAAWANYAYRLEPILGSLQPLLAGSSTGELKRIIAGPLADAGAAAEMCLRLERESVSCQPVPYRGAPLPEPAS